MAPFTVQTLFLFYSALSLSSAVLIGMLFWKKKDISAYLWFSACVLTSTATAVTVYRNEIPLLISYSLMVALETFSILLFSESLKHLAEPQARFKPGWTTFAIPAAYFVIVEYCRIAAEGQITAAISGMSTFLFGVANLFCLHQAMRVRKKFTSRLFFNFLSVTFVAITTLYFLRSLNVTVNQNGYIFDAKNLNVTIWFVLNLFGTIRNLAYIVLRLQLGFTEHQRLNNMNLRLSNILQERNDMILSIEKLNKTVSVNTLSSTLVHEINQPLGAARLNAELAEMSLEQDASNITLHKSAIRKVLHDIDRVSAIVQNLSKINASKDIDAASVSLHDSIAEVAEMSKGKLHKLGIELTTKCPQGQAIQINKGLWQQVLINLINNAIEALEGQIEGQRKIEIACIRKNNFHEITVCDNGAGIPEGMAHKIFELMVSNKDKGSGIGLWLSKNIIQRYDGNITARNLPEGGACLRIQLPAA